MSASITTAHLADFADCPNFSNYTIELLYSLKYNPGFFFMHTFWSNNSGEIWTKWGSEIGFLLSESKMNRMD
jgi:hypothetical protein